MSIPRNKSLTVSLEIALSVRDDGNLYIIQQQNAINTALQRLIFLQYIIPATMFLVDMRII